MTFIKNASSWQCSYIGEQWFFLPYIILMASSKYIFRLYDKFKWHVVSIMCLCVYAATIYTLKCFGEATLAENMLFYNIFLVFYMLFPFTMGYIARKYEWMEKLKTIIDVIPIKNQIIAILGLIVLCSVSCCIGHASIAPFYSIAFILLFSLMKIGKQFGVVLTYLCKHSMNVWLIHTWFCTRLFHDFFYDTLHYPLLMYVCLLTISLFVSHIVLLIYKLIDKHIVNRMNLIWK